ncbi:MAG: SDR family NAD(P)-dependent oxidoreductase [Paracoccaceae bacterium]
MTTRTAIVTGGLSGMGLAIAARLSRDGTHVTLGARRGGDAAHVTAALARAGLDGADVHATALDVTSTASVDAVMDEVMARRGRIDILVNAAGIYEEAEIADHPDAVWEAQIDTNLSGTFRAIRAAFPHMKKAGWGRIVNIASMAAHTGMPGNAAYCASKAGLLGLTRCVALEGAAHGVTCVAISPTWVETEMLRAFVDADVAATGKSPEAVRADYAASNPQGRLVQPQEIAELAAYLTSDAARAVTMTDVQVNAGSPW